MKYKVCLSIKTFIFYAIIGPFIVIGSLYNLIGIIKGTNEINFYGAFSLAGFLLIPLALYSVYSRNKAEITNDSIKIGKNKYTFADHDFSIIQKEIPFKDRPIFSIFKKNYYDLIIKQKNTNKVVFEKDLDVFEKNIEMLTKYLPLI